MSIEELNALARSGEMDEFIRVCEARQVKALSHLADAVCSKRGVRLVLLAGASSAGKTTTAKRLCTQIRVNGCAAVHFSTDDYFVGDKRNPRDENGELDYEHVDCVDRQRLAADLNALMSGARVHPRRFDFIAHEGYDAEEEMGIPKDGLIVLEGIHALNPILTEAVAESCKFRLFVEPRPKIEVFVKTRLSSSYSRLIRRLVRDNQFRRIDPSETFRLWPKVLEGEKKWINPFRPNADAEFDSGLDYELAVLKPYVQGLLEIVRRRDAGNLVAQQLAELFMLVETVPPVTVPGDSILRETIGSSQLTY